MCRSLNPDQASIFLLNLIYLFDRERAQAGGAAGRGRRRAGSLTWGSIPGHWDHDLSGRQTLNRLSHPGAPANTSLQREFMHWVWQPPALGIVPDQKRVENAAPGLLGLGSN